MATEDPKNASSSIPITLAGITTKPAHEFVDVTTPSLIIIWPTVQFSIAVTACAGLRTSPDMTKTSAINRVTNLPCLPSDPADLLNKGTPPRECR